MEIINPNLVLKNDINLFTIRKLEYDQILNILNESLNPIIELGYSVEKFGISPTRIQSDDLSKTYKSRLELVLMKNETKVDLSVHIPSLIDDNYIFINGRKKVPHYQLIDFPLTVKYNKKIENSFIVKFRSNVFTSILYEKGNSFPKLTMSMIGKRIPFALLLMCFYNEDEINNLLNEYNKYNNMYDILLNDLKYYRDQKLDKDKYFKLLGENYTRFNIVNKGKEILYALDIIPKIDIITKKFMRYDSVIEEILNGIKNGPFDDADYINKRIRCFEYLILGPIFRSMFNLCILSKNSKTPKFNVNKSEIIQNCNVSDIVQFDFSINPIGSLTELSRVSLLGPGGFNRKSVPVYLRDVHESMAYKIDIVDTPDRNNCGVVFNLIPNSPLDENLKFNDKTLTMIPTSIPTSFVPFLEKDDPTRLQMAASQMRQAILLQNPEKPLIQSGIENLFSDKTPFLITAKNDGIVLYEDLDKDILILKYDNGELDCINIGYRHIYVDNIDLIHHNIKEGERFNKGDVLAESLFIKDKSINLGRNLLTGCTIYYGYNYEDGIVISEKLVNEKIFSSIHVKDLSFFIPTNKILLSLSKTQILENDEKYDEDSDYIVTIPCKDENGNVKIIRKKYKPLPKKGDIIEVGESYAILKKFPTKDDFNIIFEEEDELKCNKRIKILECNIYVNDYNDQIPNEYKEWLKIKIENQKSEEDKIKNVIHQHLPKKEANRFIKENLNIFGSEGKYKTKGERFEGIFVQLIGCYTRDIEIGDKIGNRHGNKGVISCILGEDKMPRLEDGRLLDIIINPLGIISRMNIGQSFELHLSMSFNDLKLNCKKMIKENIEQNEIKNYLINYIDIIDNTKEKWYLNQFKDQIKDIEIDDEFIDNLTIVQPPFKSLDLQKCRMALEYTNTKFEYKLFDPCIHNDDGTTGDYLVNEIATGFMYFFRMNHIASTKMTARGIGSYTKKMLQPTAGKRNLGGQRIGEMESSSIIAYDSSSFLYETMTTMSDCVEMKNKWMYEMIDSKNKLGNLDFDDSETMSESVKLLNSYLTVIGVDKDDN